MLWYLGLSFCISLVFGPLLLNLAAVPFDLIALCLQGTATWLKGGRFKEPFEWELALAKAIREHREKQRAE